MPIWGFNIILCKDKRYALQLCELYCLGGNGQCTYAANNPSACFVYNLPSELQADEVTTAEFWLYKNKESSGEQTNGGQDFVLSEISHSKINKHMDRTIRIATENTVLSGKLTNETVMLCVIVTWSNQLNFI